ncbi:MAG: VanZ family protein [Nitrospirae bacterium]|nr:VanZ family protein [Nitrospirota bacterium]
MKTVIIWLSVVFVLSVYPFKGGAGVPYRDEAIHFIVYAITCALFFTFLIRRMRLLSALVVSVLLSAGYGLLMEVIQQVITASRRFSVSDVVSNIAGAISSAVFIAVKRRGR